MMCGRRWDIHTRTQLISVGPALLLTLLLTGFFTHSRLQDLRQEIDHTGQLMANQLAPAAVHGVTNGDTQALENLLRATLQAPNVRFLEVRDQSENILVYVEQPRADTTSSVDVFHAPIRRAGETSATYLGRVVVGMSDETFTSRQQAILLKATMLALVALLLTFFLARQLARRLARPLSAMGRTLEAIKAGDYRPSLEETDSGELGELRRSNWIITNWYRSQSYYNSGGWRATWKGEGGGVLVNQAPHQLDLWQWICGIPVKVFSKNINGCHRNIGVENDVTMLVEFANGATGTFTTCTHDAIGTDRLEIDLDGGKIVVDNSKTAHVYHYIDKEGNPCTEDYLNEHMNMMEVAMLTSGNGAGSKLYTEETFENNDGWGFQHTTVMQNFAAHILTGSPLLAPGEDGINGVNLANSSQLSAWTGREVSNPCDPEEYAAELNKLIEAEGKFPVRE